MKDLKAIIADDEKSLRQFMKTRLADIWPELIICGEAENGHEAIELIERLRPEIAFLDIRMPGLTGMDVAGKIAGTCRVVFVTAYDDYAVEAFEKEAVDYLLKPVSVERLKETVRRLKQQISKHPAPPEMSPELMQRLMDRLYDKGQAGKLQYIRVQQGEGTRLIPVDEVIYFKADDKYTTVMTKAREWIIRKPIKTLAAELDPDLFWQIHRGTLVNVLSITQVSRSLTGGGVVRLKERAETLKVSNRYMHLFKQM